MFLSVKEKIKKKSLIIYIYIYIYIFLFGCTTNRNVSTTLKPFINVKSRRTELTEIPQPERGKWCHGSMERARLSQKVIIHGQIRNHKANVQIAGNTLFDNIAAYYAGEDRAAEIIHDTLREIVKINAFTKLVPYFPPGFGYKDYNPMNEGVWQLANFMLPLSHSYIILKEEYPENKVLLSKVRRWGDTLFEITKNGGDDFQGLPKGMDRRALKAAGWAAWGNVTNNHKILTHAHHHYILSLYSIGQGGKDQLWKKVKYKHRIYYANMNFSAALVAAHILNQSGVKDVYTIAPGGGNIVEGMAWLWNTIFKNKSYLLRPRDKGSKSVAWVDLFLNLFPDHPVSVKINTWLKKEVTIPRYGNMNGGPTTCLYRQINPVLKDPGISSKNITENVIELKPKLQ